MGEEPDALFPNLQQNVDGSAGTEIDSLCMNCHAQGITRLLMTNIPFFKEVVIMSFQCDHCGFRSSEVQPGGKEAEFGVDIKCSVESAEDLQRSILISDSAVLKIPEVELEIPSSKRGRLTTVEGVLNEVIEDLSFGNDERREKDPDMAEKITVFVTTLAMLKSGTKKFHIEIRDISGNSSIEGLEPGKVDRRVVKTTFKRSAEEDESLGLQPYTEDEAAQDDAHTKGETANGAKEGDGEVKEGDGEVKEGDGEAVPAESHPGAISTDEVIVFPDHCPACGRLGENRIKLQDIPFFKQVVLIAFTCDYCGYRSNEVKPGGKISDKGRKTTLSVTCVTDLSRDILKSDTAFLDVPEIGLTLEPGTLGSVFTTIEGILLKTKENLMSANPLSLGESAQSNRKARFKEFYDSIDKLIAGTEPFTIILDDPAGNSFIQNVYAPDPDPEMKIDLYERDEEQNEELGLPAEG